LLPHTNIAISTDSGKSNMGQVFELTDKDFTKEVKLSEKPVVLVEFYALWSEGYQDSTPVFEEIAGELEYVKCCRVDVDKAQKIAARYGVLSTPTYLVFHNAQIVNQQLGQLTKDELKCMVI